MQERIQIYMYTEHPKKQVYVMALESWSWPFSPMTNMLGVSGYELA